MPTTCCASVAAAFGLPAKAVDKATLLASLEAFLCRARHRQASVRCSIVDEAQNLTPRAVEELRMLSNFQLGEQALLQSFLVGQPELRTMMQGPQMQQLRQRVIASYHLGPIDKDETQRLHRAPAHACRLEGRSAASIPRRSTLIHVASGGIPRRINTLCNRLLLAGFLVRSMRFERSRRARDRARDPARNSVPRRRSLRSE